MVDDGVVQNLQGVLNAYMQQFAPDLSEGDLPSTIEAIVPLVVNGGVTKPEVLALVQRVASLFDRRLGLSQEIKPEYLRLARELFLCMTQKPLEEAVQETIVAYIKAYEPTLESVGEGLIESTLAAIVNGQVEFDWDIELNLEDKNLLIKQVAFKLNVMQADPMPSKTAQELAAQIQGEVARFRKEQAAALGQADLTGGLVGSDALEISSVWTRPNPEG
ncbi:MAG: hypothetical protein ICV62_03095 [Cyanobacteria bacterium Co-bin13]|nr:hypothetical protein [Cyanobacteria bacterium Co-bin13]